MEGGLLKTKPTVPELQAELFLSVACQRIPTLQTSCEASQGRASSLLVLFSAAAAAINLPSERKLSSELPLPWRLSQPLLHSTGLLFFVVVFFPLRLHFPHTQAGLSLSLTDSLWTHSKGCVHAIKHFPFCFYHNSSRPDKGRQREGTGRVKAQEEIFRVQLLWGQLKGAREGSRSNHPSSIWYH